MIITGRVLALPSPEQLVLVDGTRHLVVRVTPPCDLRPGDLVRIDAEPGAALSDDAIGPPTARTIERVFRAASRSPFAPGTETHSFLADGKLARLEARARVVAAVRAHFASQGSLEIDTPAIATSPGLDLHLHAFEVVKPMLDRRSPDESGRRESVIPPGLPHGYLITSPEYHMKRLLVGGVRRCHQFARCFRVDEDGARHEPEFTMLEWYRAWDEMDAMLADTFAVVRAAASAVGVDALVVRGAQVALDNGFDVMTVREAFARWASDVRDPIALANQDESEYFAQLVDRIEPHLGRERPVFLTQFAARHASLARLNTSDPSVCDRFELYANGMELSNGFVELTDPDEQRARFDRDQRERAAAGLPVYPLDERFLAALDEGMPPSVGNALGFDRLVALVLGRSAIADVIAFPVRRR